MQRPPSSTPQAPVDSPSAVSSLIPASAAGSPPTASPLPASSPPSSPPLIATRARWRDLAGPALFEAAFVVLGVVLALAANEWREARQHVAEAENARVAIANELRTNRAAAEQSMIYHRELARTIFSARGDSAISIATFARGFVLPAQLSTTAWEVAAQTGALGHMPYDRVLAISQAVALERRYDAMAVSTGQLIYSELYRIGPTGVAENGRNLASIVAAFAYREEGVIAKIDTTLGIIDPKRP